MKKQDIIRIINEEIEFALEEQEKQLYKVVDKKNRNAFMAGWNQSKANLGKGKIKGDVRDIDAWMEYSQGKGSEEEKDAFLQGWFKARTTTKLSDVEKILNDKDKIIKPDESSNIKGLTKRIATKLAAKNPNWSVEKINEMYDPIYDSMIPEIAVMLMAGGLGIKAAIKYLKEKGLNKQDIIDIINKAKNKLNELKATNKGKDITKHLNDYLEGKINKSEFEKLTGLKKESINENTKHHIVVYDGKRLAIEPEDLERLKSGKDIVGKNLKYAGQEEWIYAKGDWKIEEPIN